MEYNFITNIESCHTDVPSLLYYSHIPSAIIALIFGIFILLKSKENRLSSKIFFFISLIFSSWVFIEGSIWLLYNSINMMFLWSFLGLLYSLLHILSVYFVYVFIDKKDVSLNKKLIFVLLLFPIILLTATKYNITGFDIDNCQALEGNYFILYRYFLGAISIIWIVGLLVSRYRKPDRQLRKQILLLGLGILSFLFLFSWSEIIGSVTENFNITQYGLFGMPIFLGLLAYLIVQFHSFNIKLLATQALVWGLTALIGAQFFFIKVPINFLLTGVTFVASIILGYFLIRSVKKEVQQKEELEKLTAYLEIANQKLKAFDTLKSKFLSLASHQLRNPISAIISCTSMFLDGSFGKIDDTQTKMLSQMYDRAKGMNDDVEKYLTIAKVDQGGLQYNLEKLDLADFAKNITEQQKLAAEKRNLVLSFETDGQSSYFVNGDKVQLKQVFQNLIDNGMKYTKEGWIKVKLSKDEKANKIRLTISDSGMGIKPEIMPTLFKEFSRGEGAKVDVGGSGIGIYLAKEIIEKGHHGKIWAESEGAGKGSAFIFELDAVK